MVSREPFFISPDFAPPFAYHRRIAMKALTIHQPWASLIITGEKTLENRGWRTTYRGPLLIHAGLVTRGITFDLPRGVILGVVDLVDCVPLADVAGQPFAEGPICWKLSNPRRFPRPIPLRGKMGVFDVPDDLVPARFRPLTSSGLRAEA